MNRTSFVLFYRKKDEYNCSARVIAWPAFCIVIEKKMMVDQEDFLQANTQGINHVVQQVFEITDVTTGTSQQFWMYRFRGHLHTNDSEKAFDQLTKNLNIFHLKPLFRLENGAQVVYLIADQGTPPPSNPRINLLLFIATIISVWVTGGLMSLETLNQQDMGALIKAILFEGWPFALSLIAILGAHEMGHFLVGRYHGVNVSLPYFIPLPIVSPFGTMGAFINMRGIPKNKKQLLDIGVAGPLSGLVLAIPIVMIGLSLSSLQNLPVKIGEGMALQIEGNSLLYLLLKYLMFGQLLPQPVDFGNLPPMLYWLKYFFTGQPVPLGGLDVTLHPVAWAGWAGILVTSLNLIPIGQLDGGHILSAIAGDKSRRLFNFFLVGLLILGFGWNGWWFWAALLFLLNRIPSQVADEITPLDKKRKLLAIFMLVVFLLVFIPVPLVILT